MKTNPLLSLSEKFAIDTNELCDSLSSLGGVSNMLFRLRKSSSGIYANIFEAQYPQSLSDMLSKHQIEHLPISEVHKANMKGLVECAKKEKDLAEKLTS